MGHTWATLGGSPHSHPFIFSLQIRVRDLQYNLKGIFFKKILKFAFVEKKISTNICSQQDGKGLMIEKDHLYGQSIILFKLDVHVLCQFCD